MPTDYFDGAVTHTSWDNPNLNIKKVLREEIFFYRHGYRMPSDEADMGVCYCTTGADLGAPEWASGMIANQHPDCPSHGGQLVTGPWDLEN